jgi:4-aminobutyrate aminotransferase-like enzyme
VDLGGAFAVANAGHAHPRIAAAVAAQAARLMHGMGDVHPPAVKVELLEALAARFPGGGPARAVLGSSGADAVEAALETAQLASGRAGAVAFDGGYHGLSSVPSTSRRAPTSARRSSRACRRRPRSRATATWRTCAAPRAGRASRWAQ